LPSPRESAAPHPRSSATGRPSGHCQKFVYGPALCPRRRELSARGSNSRHAPEAWDQGNQSTIPADQFCQYAEPAPAEPEPTLRQEQKTTKKSKRNRAAIAWHSPSTVSLETYFINPFCVRPRL